MFYDLSTPLTENTTIYPGDNAFTRNKVCSLDKGDLVDVCHISLSNHLGTHIDFPSHVVIGGKASQDYSLIDLSGKMYLIEAPYTEATITRDFIISIFSQLDVQPDSIVFFKTRNSSLDKSGDFHNDYVYIEPTAAKELVQWKIRIVGIDYLSVDPYESDLPVHKMLLGNDVLIVENLNLAPIPQGIYQVFIVPLNIPNMDGLPVRAFAENSIEMCKII